MTGSAVAAGSSLDGAGADALVAAPGSGGAFVLGGTGQPAPATAAVPAAPAVERPAAKPASHKKPALRLCPRTRAKAVRKSARGTRLPQKPRHCRPRPAIPARGGEAIAVPG